jgi:hypothetical protein
MDNNFLFLNVEKPVHFMKELFISAEPQLEDSWRRFIWRYRSEATETF